MSVHHLFSVTETTLGVKYDSQRRRSKTLPPVASERDLVGLQECPHELADQKWEDDVTKCSEVELPHIVLHLRGTWIVHQRKTESVQEPKWLQLLYKWLGGHLFHP